MRNNDANVSVMDPKALAGFGRKLKKLTAALVREAEIKHERLMLNNLSVEQDGGLVFEGLEEWADGFDAGAMVLLDLMLTPSEREISQVVTHDAISRFAEVGTCPAPVFIAMVFDKMSKAGVEKLDRFCDPGFCVAWTEGDGKNYCSSMGTWATDHAGASVYNALLSGEIECLYVFGEKGSRKSLIRSFKWDDGLGDMP